MIIVGINQSSINADAHSGNTDDYGGHYDHSRGTYHCHSGECMEDAQGEARDACYPLGVEDAQERREKRDILSELSGKVKADEGYLSIYCFQYYTEGYNDTYVPTFWEKYGFIVKVVLVLLLIGFFFKYKDKLRGYFSKEKVVTCKSCGTKNRLVLQKDKQLARCGKCKKFLF
jgi:hypothetical protein